ncbi:activator of the anaphase-promoting complex/cyclosome (APC/C) Cdh1p [Perkinsela sp. CCAP 1560/4]|nr:activator of the anaphase-promoting complex/cyclosome (APC/C) Cdh1p [Perkinsela sp. CCAP 1560/4]|eukprot:KNH06315.1 activator of the anaphase-promoting complex/cyclosome (APC/C) Cdh1p [Perkinsela sp. CCAP 1560/4]
MNFADLDYLYETEMLTDVRRPSRPSRASKKRLFHSEPLERLFRGRASRCTPVYGRDTHDTIEAQRAFFHPQRDTCISAPMHDNILDAFRPSRRSAKREVESHQTTLDRLLSTYTDSGNLEAHRRRFGNKVIRAMLQKHTAHTERIRPSAHFLRMGPRLSNLPRCSALRESIRLSDYQSPRQPPARKRSSMSFSNGVDRILDAPGVQWTPCVRQLSWSNADLLAISLTDQMYVWDATTLEAHHIHSLTEPQRAVTCVSWTPGASQLAFSDHSGATSLLDVESGRLIRVEAVTDGKTMPAPPRVVTAHSWNANTLAVGTSDGYISFLDRRCARWSQTVKCSDAQNTVAAIAYAPSHSASLLAIGMAALSGLSGGPSGSELQNIERSTRTSARDNGSVHERDKTVNIYDTRFLRRFVDDKSFVTALRTGSSTSSLAWHPQHSARLITGSRNGVLSAWDTSRGVVTKRHATGRAIGALAVSSEYNEVITAHYGFPFRKDCFHQLHLWSLNDFSPISPFGQFEAQSQASCQIMGVLDAALSQSGENVCALTGDESLKFWKVFPREK